MTKTNHKIKHRLSRLIMVLTVSTMLFGCMGCSKKTPREALDEAFEKTFVTNNPTESVLGMSKISSHINSNKAYSSGFSVTLQELSVKDIEAYADSFADLGLQIDDASDFEMITNVLSGFGISVDSATDPANQKSAGTVDISYGGATYLTLAGQLQGSKVYLSSPQLIDGSLTADLSTLEDDLSSGSLIGELVQMYGIELSDETFSELLQTVASPASLAGSDALKASYDSFCDDIQVEKLDKKSVDFSSDVTYKTAYRVTIPKYAYSTLLTAVLRNTGEAYTGIAGEGQLNMLDTKLAIQQIADTVGDLVIDVAVNKKGYITYARCNVNTGAEKISLTASFNGKTNPLDDTDVVLSLTTNGQTYKLIYSQDYKSDTKEVAFNLSVKVNDRTELKLSGAGKYTGITKGKKFTFDYDYIELKVSDELTVSISGDVYVDITECNIPTPSSPERNIFRMSEEDFYDLGDEIMANIEEDRRLSRIMELFN